MNSKPQSEKKVVLANHTQEIYAGPVPHPEILKGFQTIDPSFPERIMKMAGAVAAILAGFAPIVIAAIKTIGK